MNRLDDHDPKPDGDGDPSPDAKDRRIRELEDEIRKLRLELDEANEALEWYRFLGMPQSEAEMLELARTGPSISDVIAEFDREFPNEHR